jgi:transcription elongation factor Elf1
MGVNCVHLHQNIDCEVCGEYSEIHFNPLKRVVNIYTTLFNIQSICIFGICTILRINSDYFPTQHYNSTAL